MVISSITDLSDDAFGHHLAGLIDGEGCFMIIAIPRQWSYCTRLTIKLRADDRPLLDAIQKRTGLGSVYRYPRGRSTSHPQVGWLVNSQRDCGGLVRLLDCYPLLSKKARDYEIWKRAVAAIVQKRTRSRRAAPRQDWSDLAALKTELEAVRAYGASRETVRVAPMVRQLQLPAYTKS